MTRTSRTPSHLPESLGHRLNSYALAASAAGVGVLALPQSAEAKIIYRPTHRHIVVGHPAVITLDHGAATFTMYVKHGTTNRGTFALLFASGRVSRGSVGGFTSSHGGGIAYAFNAGSVIGPKRLFRGNLMNGWTALSGGFCFGEQFGWGRDEDAYLGLRLPPLNGQYRYGWARLNTHCNDRNVTALLRGYAYETIPNKPIITGKTKGRDVITVNEGSLGALAAGAVGRSGK